MVVKAKATMKSKRSGEKACKGHLNRGGDLNLPASSNEKGRSMLTRNMASKDFFETPLLKEPLNWKTKKAV